jgi:hypothetical protein
MTVRVIRRPLVNEPAERCVRSADLLVRPAERHVITAERLLPRGERTFGPVEHAVERRTEHMFVG